MSRRTRVCDDAVAAGRLRKVEQFVDAAETVRESLRTLLGMKTRAGYAAEPVAAQDRKRAQRQTERLVRAARDRSTPR